MKMLFAAVLLIVAMTTLVGPALAGNEAELRVLEPAIVQPTAVVVETLPPPEDRTIHEQVLPPRVRL